MPSPDILKIKKILDAHKEKNFVKRILSPDDWPTIDNQDGSYSTHKMSWSSIGSKANGIHAVYPNIIYDDESGGLIELPPKDAYEHAINTGEYIRFDNASDADWFSRNYKNVWKK